jgi:hypothetical protein
MSLSDCLFKRIFIVKISTASVIGILETPHTYSLTGSPSAL